MPPKLKKQFTLENCLYVSMILVFSLVYCRNFLFSAKDVLPGTKTVDYYYAFYLAYVIRTLNTLPLFPSWVQGIFSTGWGGCWNGLTDFSTIVLSVLQLVTGSFSLSLRWLVYGLLLMSSITSYFYSHMITGRKDASIVASVIYTFSWYHLGQIQGGHILFLAAAGLIPLVLAVWEKNFKNPTLRNAAVSSFVLILLALTELQHVLFTLFFLFFRLVYHLLYVNEKGYFKQVFVNLLVSATIFMLVMVPIVYPFSQFYPVLRSQFAYFYWSIEPHSFFLRTVRDFWEAEFQVAYLGLAALTLMLSFFLFAKKKFSLDYLFHNGVGILFLMVCMGQYSIINVVHIFSFGIPFASSTVLARSYVLAALCFSVCASFGYIQIADHIRNVNVRKVLPFILVVLVFMDMSWFLPSATPTFELNSGHSYLREQQGEGRVLKLPIYHSVSAYESYGIGHTVLASDYLLRFYPTMHIWDYVDNWTTFKDPDMLAKLSAYYGVKYVFIDLNQSSYEEWRILRAVRTEVEVFDNLTRLLNGRSDFPLVYRDETVNIYENLNYQGLVFALEPLNDTRFSNANVSYRWKGNSLLINVEAEKPIVLIISQSYTGKIRDRWTLTDGEKSYSLTEYYRVMGASLPAGPHSLALTFHCEDMYTVFVLSYLALAIFLILVLRKNRGLNPVTLIEVSSSHNLHHAIARILKVFSVFLIGSSILLNLIQLTYRIPQVTLIVWGIAASAILMNITYLYGLTLFTEIYVAKKKDKCTALVH